MTAAMTTKRKFAHELYPHPDEDVVQPLADALPYLYARAHGLRTFDMKLPGRDAPDHDKDAYFARIELWLAACERALLADALHQGLTGQDAWQWAEERRNVDSLGEWLFERAVVHGVDPNAIKPYGPEPEEHWHYSEPDARGFRWSTGLIRTKESECPDCCEPIEATS